MPEAEQGMNVARIASLRAGLPVEISAMTIIDLFVGFAGYRHLLPTALAAEHAT